MSEVCIELTFKLIIFKLIQIMKMIVTAAYR